MAGDLGSLVGKVVVVSGGTNGLGAATVRECARQGAAGLVIAGRSRTEIGRAHV